MVEEIAARLVRVAMRLSRARRLHTNLARTSDFDAVQPAKGSLADKMKSRLSLQLRVGARRISPTPRRLVFGATVPFQLETLVMPTVPGLIEDGWEVHLVAAGTPGVRSAGVEYHEIPMTRAISPARDLLALFRWWRLLGRVQPSVLVVGSPKASLLAMLAGLMRRTPARTYLVRGLRWEAERGLRRRILLLLESLTVSAATDVVAVSRSLAQELSTHSRAARKRPPTVLGHGGSKGVDLTRYHPHSPETKGSPTIGYVGRLSSDKGIGTLLRVHQIVRRDVPDARLLVIGGPDPAQPIDNSTTLALRSNPGVEWLGHVADPSSLYGQFHVFLFPSLREGLPNAVLEAGASGVPSVGWDVTGTRDAIDDGHTGYLVPFGDINQLAERVRDILQNDHLRRTLGDGAVTWVTMNFDADAVQSRFRYHLVSALGQP